MRRIRQRWPGARNLLEFGLETEFAQRPPQGPAERLFRDLLVGRAERDSPGTLAPAPGKEVDDKVRGMLLELVDASANVFESAARVRESWTAEVVAAYPRIETQPVRTFSFLPDCTARTAKIADEAQDLLRQNKIKPERLKMAAVCSVCAESFVKHIDSFFETLKQLGPAKSTA